MNSLSTLSLIVIFLLLSPLCLATRPGYGSSHPVSSGPKQKKGGGGIPGFNIPGLGGGYGFGVGGPNGGYVKGGVIVPSVVCKDRGPCFHKKLTCPPRCFNSYNGAGKGYGYGGGGGNCSLDCKKCKAYC